MTRGTRIAMCCRSTATNSWTCRAAAGDARRDDAPEQGDQHRGPILRQIEVSEDGSAIEFPRAEPPFGALDLDGKGRWQRSFGPMPGGRG